MKEVKDDEEKEGREAPLAAPAAADTKKDPEPHEVNFERLEKGRGEGASDPEPQTELPPWKLTLVILTASSVLMSLSYTMLIPFLPMYLIKELGVAQSDVNLWSGIVFSSSFVISGIMAPIWGAMSEMNSRKLIAVLWSVFVSLC